MCELFGITGRGVVQADEYLKEFFSHSTDHPHGWGMAFFYGDSVSLEKEPLSAYKSRYLKTRLQNHIETRGMFAHIRLATKGGEAYENCHPFVKRDVSGRAWTLMHNGTIFECPQLQPFVSLQKGRTDSERILLYLIDQINARTMEEGRPLTEEERFQVLDRIVCEITPVNNKVNLLIFDGDLTYVHSNMEKTIHSKTTEESVIFSTVPLDKGRWTPLELNTLMAYRQNKKVYTGTNHGNEYHYHPEDFRYLYLDEAYL